MFRESEFFQDLLKHLERSMPTNGMTSENAHLHAHGCGMRDGWRACLKELEDFTIESESNTDE